MTFPRLPGLVLAAGLLCLGFAGCVVAPSVAMVQTIAGGESFEVKLDSKGVERAEDKDAKVTIAGIIIDSPSKKAGYNAEIQIKSGFVPTHIVMEDISEDPVVMVLNDEHPVVTAEHLWKAVSTYRELDDSRFKWLMPLDNSVRVYRFTITTEDGRTLVYRQAAFYTSYVKEAIRRQLGSKY